MDELDDSISSACHLCSLTDPFENVSVRKHREWGFIYVYGAHSTRFPIMGITSVLHLLSKAV